MRFDLEFFKQCEVIDYSMLVGVCDLPDAEEGQRLLDKHNQNTDASIDEKTAQILHKDYGNLLHDNCDRFDTQFYDSIEGGIVSRDRKKVYFLGIIDILTHYSGHKVFEYFSKSLIYGKSMSVAPPDKYGDRFDDYMRTIFE